MPVVLGHEWSGTVAAVGSGVDVSLLGRRVVGDNVIGPGANEVGFEYPGALAQFFISREPYLHPVPDGVDEIDAAHAEPIAVAAHAVSVAVREASTPCPEPSALVYGPGSIGLFVTQLLVRNGWKVGVVGISDSRLAQARRIGATVTYRYDDLERNEVVERWNKVFEVSGDRGALQSALATVADHGLLILVGSYNEGVSLDPREVVVRNLRVRGVNTASGFWRQALDYLADRSVTTRIPDPLIVPRARSIGALRQLLAGEISRSKVLISDRPSGSAEAEFGRLPRG